MDQRGSHSTSALLWVALAAPLFGCVHPGAGPRAPGPEGPGGGPPGEALPGDSTQVGDAVGDTVAGDELAAPTAAASNAAALKESAAKEVAELIEFMTEQDAAPLLTAYAETNGVDGVAKILVRLEPSKRSKLISELRRTKPKEVALYVDALARAAVEASLTEQELREEANQVVESWHKAAAEGDRDGYLGSMTPEARFLGTDSAERWDMTQFTSYVEEHFVPGSGWTFEPKERVLLISASGTTAWFDERLFSDSYGELRGTGALERVEDVWKVAHYSMTFTVPNDVAGDVVDAVGRSAQ